MLDVEQRSVPSEAGAPLWQKVRAELGDYFRKNIRRDVPILTFHRIRRRDGIKVETLTRILDFVASEYRVFTLGELAVTLDRKTRLPRNGIVLTFDDGTKDQFELAGPELNKRGLRATFALVGCTLLERTVPPLFAYFHMLETTQMRSVRFGFKALLAKRTWSLDEAGRRELTNMRSPIVRAIQESRHCVGAEIVATFGAAVGAAPPKVDDLFMSVQQMDRLRTNGHEAAGHSVRHQDVDEPTAAAWVRDLEENLAIMNEAFGGLRHPYIYPFGRERRPEKHHAVREAGFCCAATTEWGTNRRGASPFGLRRVGIDDESHVPFATIY